MSVYQTVLASIVADIERGADTYQMPWHATATPFALPTNVTTGDAYRGLNILVLWTAIQKRNYGTSSWATYRQWDSIGAQVRKGERGTPCVKWKELPDPAGAGELRRVPLGFTLFNADQVDGFAPPDVSRTPNSVEAHGAADTIIAASGVEIVHAGQSAYYRPSTDTVVLPEQWRFRATEAGSATTAYYATVLHELTHATGAKHRLDRDSITRYGADLSVRAAEELVAELGAAFCCARLGLTNTPRPDHACYVASWLAHLKSQPNALTKAASRAQAAADWLLNRLPAPAAHAASDSHVLPAP
jgi:antirestriction protein ArdC